MLRRAHLVDVSNQGFGDKKWLFTIKLRHGGSLVEENGKENYIGGRVSAFDFVDKRRMSMEYLGKLCAQLGYLGEKKYYRIDDFKKFREVTMMTELLLCVPAKGEESHIYLVGEQTPLDEECDNTGTENACEETGNEKACVETGTENACEETGYAEKPCEETWGNEKPCVETGGENACEETCYAEKPCEETGGDEACRNMETDPLNIFDDPDFDLIELEFEIDNYGTEAGLENEVIPNTQGVASQSQNVDLEDTQEVVSDDNDDDFTINDKEDIEEMLIDDIMFDENVDKDAEDNGYDKTTSEESESSVQSSEHEFDSEQPSETEDQNVL
ncbi:hypothetical protein DH2020_003276 [Rehmannia glutinosa]|uniref:PB1-like domain-containing protein n=1 Tax=Rehmannia glutinosa TaxID=99300 RepID=A0ABR0XL60_REHGL